MLEVWKVRSREPSHGYELMGRLAELGVEPPPSTGVLYRLLRTMAGDGVVSSYWSTPQRGPARSVYAMTEHREQQLEQAMPASAGVVRTVRECSTATAAGGAAERLG